MSRIEITNQLPHEHKSWIEFYVRNFDEWDRLSAKTIAYSHSTPGNPEKLYKFSVDFVKARAWDEFMKLYPSMTDYDDGYGTSHPFNPAWRCIDKLDQILGIKRSSRL